MAETAHTSGRNNPWLDLIRAIAIAFVLLRHGEHAFSEAGRIQLGPLKTIAANGWLGVDLFFVLSGYLIARHLLRAGIGSGNFSIGRYMAMRALRIVPAYVAVIGLILIGAFPFYTISDGLIGARVAYHLLFLQDYLPSNINVVFWSLGVEEKFYILAPVLMFLLFQCRSTAARLVILAVCFMIPVMFRFDAYRALTEAIDYEKFFLIFRSPFHMTIEGIVAGVTIAVVESAGFVRRSRLAGLAVLGASSAVLLLWMSSHDFMAEIDLADAVWQPSMIAILAALMTLGAVMLAGVRMPFALPINIAARLSYSLYLVHYPLIPLVAAFAAAYGAHFFWPAYLAISIGVAVLLHLIVEKPFLAWKDRIGAREGRTPSGSGYQFAPPAI